MWWQRADDATVRAESDRNPIWSSLGRKRNLLESTNELQESLALGHSSFWDPEPFGTLYSQLCFSCPMWFVFLPADSISLLTGNSKSCRALHRLGLVCVCVGGGGAQPPHLDSRVGRREKAVPESRQTRRWTCASLAYQDRVLSLCEIKVEACLVWHRSSRIYRQHYRPIQG